LNGLYEAGKDVVKALGGNVPARHDGSRMHAGQEGGRLARILEDISWVFCLEYLSKDLLTDHRYNTGPGESHRSAV
jgi:hypothetical protein